MTSFRKRYQHDVRERLSPIQVPDVLRESDVEHLPDPVRKYIRFSGSVGKPKVTNLQVEFSGEMKQKPGSAWITVSVSQHSFFDNPARFFYIRSSLFGIPFDGYHRFSGPHAVMEIRIANLFRIVNGHGPLMDQSETVTHFNDMCFLAPATLIDPAIEWESFSDTEIVAYYTNPNNGIRISAVLTFGHEGELVNFKSNDRFYSADGIHGEAWPWSTPITRYSEVDGRRFPEYGEAVWHTPDGPFSYARFTFGTIRYNVAISDVTF
jgi:hypothetical protein